jgi:hypothetical protein
MVNLLARLAAPTCHIGPWSMSVGRIAAVPSSFARLIFRCSCACGDVLPAPLCTEADKLQLDPSVPALHYGVQCFEGMKAYKDAQGKVRLFRPELNMKRFHDSCTRLALPDLDEEGMLQSIAKFVRLEEAWVPDVDGCSLYLRPTCIGTVSKASIFLRPPPYSLPTALQSTP